MTIAMFLLQHGRQQDVEAAPALVGWFFNTLMHLQGQVQYQQLLSKNLQAGQEKLLARLDMQGSTMNHIVQQLENNGAPSNKRKRSEVEDTSEDASKKRQCHEPESRPHSMVITYEDFKKLDGKRFSDCSMELLFAKSNCSSRAENKFVYSLLYPSFTHLECF